MYLGADDNYYLIAMMNQKSFPGFAERSQDPDDELVIGTRSTSRPMVAASLVLVTATVAIAVLAGPLSAISGRAASDIMSGRNYTAAVLGGAHE